MIQKFAIEDFLNAAGGHPIIDVRAPAEYRHGHIPGAVSLPLFSDEERAIVGTLYKQTGREAAMLKGLEYYGTNMLGIIAGLKSQTSDTKLFVHCWRGGMRSGVVSWMLDLFGYQVTVLNKGYKSFRRTVLESFAGSRSLLILGGKTGSAKTNLLEELIRRHQQVIDLEGLAAHKGSAFGALGQPAAPTQEQFENELFMQFRSSNKLVPTWLEDESQRIGQVNLPNALWLQMRNAPVIYLEIPFEVRLNYLVQVYGGFSKEALMESTFRIRKRLGGLETDKTLKYIESGDMKSAFAILLAYYDKNYLRATAQRNPASIIRIESDTVQAVSNADLILQKTGSSMINASGSY